MSNELAAFNSTSLLSSSVRGSSNARYLSSHSIAYALERLALIEPEIVAGVPCTMQAYAFAYLDRYRGNVPLLERERDFLIAALVQSWQQGQLGQVVQLLDGLLYLVGRLEKQDEAEQLLLWGIEASTHTHDQQQQAYFLNRMAGLCLSRGDYEQAQQVWKKSLKIANSCGKMNWSFWDPFATFVSITDLLGSYEAADQFVAMLLSASERCDAESLAVALLARGFHARLHGATDVAYADLTTILQLLPVSASSCASSAYKQLFSMQVQVELARVQGEYARSQEYVAATLSLAQACCDPYTVAAMLYDQALFAYWQNMFDDASTFLLRLLELSRQREVFYYAGAGSQLLKHLASVSQKQKLIAASITPTVAQGSNTQHEVLSKRELAVLQLVAEGLSNREIAEHLVITLSTVKKHLEHIHSKLNASSRTHAVAQARALRILP